MGFPRVKGDKLSMLVDGVDHWADAVSVVLDGEATEVREFGGRTRTMQLGSWFDVEAVQSTSAGSFWTFLYEHQGEDVPFGYAPHGNPLPTADEPHFTGVLTVPPPVRLGGEAGTNVDQTFTVRLHISQGPLRVTTTE